MKKVLFGYLSFIYILATLVIHVVLDTTWKVAVSDLHFALAFFKVKYGVVLGLAMGMAVFGFVLVYLFASRKVVLAWKIRLWKFTFHVRTYYNFSKKFKRVAFALWAVCLAVSVFVGAKDFIKEKKQWDYPVTIAHAGGQIDKYTYSNCLEAIELNYEQGHRTFELDFSVTSDNVLVGKHDWEHIVQEGVEPGDVPTVDEFVSRPIFGEYTPLTFEDVCHLLDEYPDMWLVTDTKNSDLVKAENDIRLIVETAKRLGVESVLDRIIIQVYNEAMYDMAKEIYPFEQWIFTMYQRWGGEVDTFDDLARFCANEGIDVITMSYSFHAPEIVEIADIYDIKIYLHTVNDVEEAQQYMDEGVLGVYTDAIKPDELRRID